MQPKEEGFGETRRKHLCQSRKMQPKEEGFGETRRKHLCRSQKWSSGTKKGKVWTNYGSWWPLKKVFIKKTQLTPDKKCEEKPRAIPISQVKRGETWNYTRLRFRSVYLGLAKRRQRRKRGPSQALVATLFQGRHKVVAVKARREGSHLTNAKLCKASGDGEGMV